MCPRLFYCIQLSFEVGQLLAVPWSFQTTNNFLKKNSCASGPLFSRKRNPYFKDGPSRLIIFYSNGAPERIRNLTSQG